MSTECDIAIVGGGLVGATMAVALGRLGYTVQLLEAVPFKAQSQPSYDDRTLALSHTSCEILRGLGIWPALENAGVTPIKEILVSEKGRFGRVRLQAQQHGVDAFGNVVEARVFGQAVMQVLAELPTVNIQCPARLTGITQNAAGVSLHYTAETSDTHSLQAALVIAADGANSFVRQALNLEVETHHYEQTAVICNITPEQPHRNRAFELFTRSGPFAVLPHVGQRCGLVWCVDKARAETLLGWSDKEFLSQAQQRFGYRLGRLQQCGIRSSYPLRMVYSRHNVQGRVVIMGNAAHTIHPTAAQGFNLGLRDVAVLAELLATAEHQTLDDGAVLQRYQQLREPDQRQTVQFADGLTRLFANPNLGVQLLRSGALAAHTLLPGLQRKLALQAMGFRAQVPALARGRSLTDIKKAQAGG